ncbi:hypothetical protein AAMO2058_000573100 [Amorphochlora amoebiformis]
MSLDTRLRQNALLWAGYLLVCGCLLYASKSRTLSITPNVGHNLSHTRPFSSRAHIRALESRFRLQASASGVGDSDVSGGEKIVVIGAGIVGSSIAYHLSKRGVMPTIIERKKVGAAASGKAGGFLARDWGSGPTEPLHQKGFELHKELASELNLSTFRPITTLSVTREAWGGAGDTGASWIGGDNAEEASIRLMDTNTAQVTPFEITTKLMEKATENGANLRIETVTGLEISEEEGSKVTGVHLESGETIPADKVIIAMGPWSTKVQDWLGVRTPMTGIYSTSLVFTAEGNEDVGAKIREEPRALFCSEDRYGTHLEVYPRSNGDIYVCGCGGSRYVSEEDLRKDQPAPGEEVADPGRVKAASESLAALAPQVAKDRNPEVSQACMRPCPPDAMPMIGGLPGYENAYIAAGHNCWGILWGPITGKIMSELILDGKSSINIKSFDPKRFGGRMPSLMGQRGRHKGSTSVGEQW